jgi:hypothetical protein
MRQTTKQMSTANETNSLETVLLVKVQFEKLDVPLLTTTAPPFPANECQDYS